MRWLKCIFVWLVIILLGSISVVTIQAQEEASTWDSVDSWASRTQANDQTNSGSDTVSSNTWTDQNTDNNWSQSTGDISTGDNANNESSSSWSNIDPSDPSSFDPSSSTGSNSGDSIPQDGSEYDPGVIYVYEPKSTRNSDDGGWSQSALRVADCNTAPTPMTPYDIDFWQYTSDQVFSTWKIVTGMVISGNAQAYTSAIPLITGLDYYLAVEDLCGDNEWHADLLASNLSWLKIYTTNDYQIAASRIKMSYGSLVYFLEDTPMHSQIGSRTFTGVTLNTAKQLLTYKYRPNQWDEKQVWLYGVKPSYILHIPQYQWMDVYQWTITWTVI